MADQGVPEALLDHPVHHSTVYRCFTEMDGGKSFLDPLIPKPRRKFKRLLKKLPQLVVEIVARRDPEDKRPVIIMAQDEGRFGRITDIRTCWAPKGIRPTVARQVVRTIRLRNMRSVYGSGQDDFSDPAPRKHGYDEPVPGGSLP